MSEPAGRVCEDPARHCRKGEGGVSRSMLRATVAGRMCKSDRGREPPKGARQRGTFSCLLLCRTTKKKVARRGETRPTSLKTRENRHVKPQRFELERITSEPKSGRVLSHRQARPSKPGGPASDRDCTLNANIAFLSPPENTNAPCGALDVCCAEGLPDQGMQIWPATGAACPRLLPITCSTPVTLAKAPCLSVPEMTSCSVMVLAPTT